MSAIFSFRCSAKLRESAIRTAAECFLISARRTLGGQSCRRQVTTEQQNTHEYIPVATNIIPLSLVSLACRSKSTEAPEVATSEC